MAHGRVCILSIAIPPYPSGAGRRAYNLALRLNKNDRLAFLLTRTKLDTKKSVLGSKIIPIAPIKEEAIKKDKHTKSLISVISFILENIHLIITIFFILLFKKNKFDIIHLFSINWTTFYTMLYSKILNKKIILSLTLNGHDDPYTIRKKKVYNTFKRKIWLWQIKNADQILVNSQQLYNSFDLAGLNNEKVLIIPSSINTQKFKMLNEFDKKNLKEKLGISFNKKPIFLFVGALRKRKGADVLFDVYSLLAKDFDKAQFIIIGNTNTEEGKHFHKKFERNFNKRSIKIIDYSDAIYEYMQIADYFIFPSRREGMPNALLEAMSCSLICLVNLIDDVTNKIINHKVNGFLIKNNNVQEYVKIIDEIEHDNKKKDLISSQSRITIEEQYSDIKIDTLYNKIYQSSD